MTLFLHLEAPTPERYQKLLRFTVTAETTEIVTFFHFQKPTRATVLGALEAEQEAFSLEKEVKFRVFCTFPKGQFYPPALLRRLMRIGCTVILRQPQSSLENRLLRAGIRIGLQQDPPRYTPETPEQFSDWLRDPAALPNPAYMNLLSAILLQIPSPDCRRSSCITRYYYLDAQDLLYLCPLERSDRTRLGQLGQAGNARELFAGEAPMSLLETAVTRRESCKHCSCFSLCQGGCPLADADCENYQKTVQAVEDALHALRDLQGLNSHATRLLLHAAAFGKFRLPTP